jgi:hypothetical protein
MQGKGARGRSTLRVQPLGFNLKGLTSLGFTLPYGVTSTLTQHPNLNPTAQHPNPPSFPWVISSRRASSYYFYIIPELLLVADGHMYHGYNY